MNQNHIEAIIFDLGNVLVDFDHRIAARGIAGFTDKTAEEIFDLFFDSKYTALFEEGKISAHQFFLRVKELLNLRLDYDEFVPIWNNIFFLTEKNRIIYNLAKSLSQHYKLALLSNINLLHFEYLKKNFPVFDAFHNIIASYAIGITKPDPLIYKKTLQVLGVLAQNTFYTDDRHELVENAKNLGIRGFVFRGVEQLKKDLISAGVDPAEMHGAR